MEQDEVVREFPMYIVCRFFPLYGKLRYDKVVYTADEDHLENALGFMKRLSNGQPGIFILFVGGERAIHDNDKAVYFMLGAAQDGKTIPITCDEKYKEKPELPLVYDENLSDFWDFPIADVESAMKEK